MPTSTYTPLANITLSSSAATVTFSSISQIYKDLVLVISVGSTAAGGSYPRLRPNNNSTTDAYSYVEGWAQASSVYAGLSTATSVGGIAGGTAPISTTNKAVLTYTIADYSSTSKHKNFLIRTDSPSVLAGMSFYRWNQTTAISSLVLSNDTGSFSSGSTFKLFGIVG